MAYTFVRQRHAPSGALEPRYAATRCAISANSRPTAVADSAGPTGARADPFTGTPGRRGRERVQQLRRNRQIVTRTDFTRTRLRLHQLDSDASHATLVPTTSANLRRPAATSPGNPTQNNKRRLYR